MVESQNENVFALPSHRTRKTLQRHHKIWSSQWSIWFGKKVLPLNQLALLMLNSCISSIVTFIVPSNKPWWESYLHSKTSATLSGITCLTVAQITGRHLFFSMPQQRFVNVLRKYFSCSPFVVRQREGKRREESNVRVKHSFKAFLTWGSSVGNYATPYGKNPSVAGLASTASTTSNTTSDSDDLSSSTEELDFLVRFRIQSDPLRSPGMSSKL